MGCGCRGGRGGGRKAGRSGLRRRKVGNKDRNAQRKSVKHKKDVKLL
jgi:hypothetical protein